MNNPPRPIITQVYVSDGSALYVDGRIVSSHFTCGESRILEALGFTKWKSIRADEKHYSTEQWPETLACVKRHRSPSKP